MKKIGLIGGLSWTSTIDYYRIINEKVNARLGGLNYAECLIYSVSFNDFVSCTSRYDWDGTFRLLSGPAEIMQQAGAEALLLCANTAHVVAQRIADTRQIPVIDIRIATINAIKKHGLNKVGLLGTVYTMELDFYTGMFAAHGIETIVPRNQSDRDMIEDTLRDELGKGILLPKTKQKYLKIIDELIVAGAQGIILGCTEIPLLIHQNDVAVPVFNTTEIHAEAAVAFMLG